jgi:threonine dehydrogenase-like Zn-dependent dehydrogenase
MKALTWHGRRDVRVDTVPDPTIEQPTDAIIRVTSSGLCGSDLHLYEVLGAFLEQGDVLGHEPMGIVEEVGPEAAKHLSVGDRVVVPFNISCGHCFMCEQGYRRSAKRHRYATRGWAPRSSATPSCTARFAGGQAEFLRIPQAHYGPIKVPKGPPDDRFLFLSDVLPTAWQAVEYAQIPERGRVAVIGLGPIGEMSCRIAQQRGAETVIGLDLVPERLARAAAHGVRTVAVNGTDDLVGVVRELTGGRGPDSVIDAVGMEAHGAPAAKFAQTLVGLMPDAVARKVMERGGVDRLSALNLAVEIVRRGGTISLSGVYGGTADPLNMLQIFDKQLTIKMGQANVRRWVDEILPLLSNGDDPLGVDAFATHHVPLAEARRPTRPSRRRRTARSRSSSCRSGPVDQLGGLHERGPHVALHHA